VKGVRAERPATKNKIRSPPVARLYPNYPGNEVDQLRNWVLPNATQPCSSLALDATSSLDNGIILINSTFVPIGALSISNTFNQVSFCQVLGSVAYGGNETLNFQLWLPDEGIYQGRFMRVGKLIFLSVFSS
jgi:hypothetical protein